MEDSKVFISHSTSQTPEALRLQNLLVKRSRGRVRAWCYEGDLPFSETIWPTINKTIRECDHFLLILSEEARKSKSVRLELGIALRSLREGGNLQPTIIGVNVGCPPKSLKIRPLNPTTKKPESKAYDFGKSRYFDFKYPVASTEADNFVSYLLPRVTCVEDFDGGNPALFMASIPCYKTLFPDRAERDSPQDIQTWFEEVRRNRSISRWREIWAVLHLQTRVTGIAFVSTHLDERFSFANYFGVVQGYRHNRRANFFLDQVSRRARELNARSDGMLFEVDYVDFDCLRNAVKQAKIRGARNEKTITEHFRRFRRLRLYQFLGAQFVLGPDNKPMPYWQPAMSRPFGPRKERRLILMYRPNNPLMPGDFDVSAAVRFIYDRLYGEAYGSGSNAEIKGFCKYVSTVRDRVKKLASQSRLGKLDIDKKLYLRLMHMAEHEGIADRLDL